MTLDKRHNWGVKGRWLAGFERVCDRCGVSARRKGSGYLIWDGEIREWEWFQHLPECEEEKG